jgi:hypothetical protein
VNDDITTKYQNAAKVDVDKDGNFVVVWQDQRNVTGQQPCWDIYCQRFNYKGEPQGNNFKVNLHDSAAAIPNVSYRKDGSFVVIWQEGVYIGQWVDSIKYLLRIYSNSGIPISPFITANNLGYYCGISSTPPAIGTDNFNNIYVAMIMIPGQYGNFHLYIQKLDSLGNKIGTNELVNDSTPNTLQFSPDITIRNDNRFIIVWHDQRYGTGDIFMQKYNTLGQKLGNNIKVNDDPIDPNIGHWIPSISSDSNGRFNIVWLDSRESNGDFKDIYCQNFDSSFSFIGSNFRVSQGSDWERDNAVIKKRKDGNFVVGWSDYWANGQGWCPYFRRFSNNNLFIGNQHWVTTYNPPQAKYLEDMTFWGDRIISVWRDWRNGNGDIFCNIRSFQNPDSILNAISKTNNEVPVEYKLYQNFPNPFNPLTNIRYQIPKNVKRETSNVKLVVFNLLGKEVAILVNEKQSPGTYEVTFDGSNLSSGIYFYCLFADGKYIDTKKFILLK